MNTDIAQFVESPMVRGDLDLVHATQGGDVSAFEELVERYDRKLFRIAEHITHNREDSQDAVQEVFLKAFEHVGDFREHSQFSTRLIRITVNQALMKLRKRLNHGRNQCFTWKCLVWARTMEQKEMVN